MAKREIVNMIKGEVAKCDKAIMDLDVERKAILEERASYVRTINYLTGENLNPEVSIHAYEQNSNGTKKYVPKIGREPSRGTKKFQVLDCIRKLGPMTSQEISKVMDYAKGGLGAQLVLLQNQKLVERDNEGRYKAVTAGDAEEALHSNGNGNGHGDDAPDNDSHLWTTGEEVEEEEPILV